MVCTHSNAVVPFSKGQLQFNFWAVIFVVAVLFTFSLVISHKKTRPTEVGRAFFVPLSRMYKYGYF